MKYFIACLLTALFAHSIGNASAQISIPEWNQRDFLLHVLHDRQRIEPDLVVYNVKCGSYAGATINDPIFLFIDLLELKLIKDENDFEGVVEFLIRGDTIPLDVQRSLKYGYQFPPEHSRIYKYRKKRDEKIIRKFFTKDLLIKPDLKDEDFLALCVVLFEKHIPLCRSGYGISIDTSTDYHDEN